MKNLLAKAWARWMLAIVLAAVLALIIGLSGGSYGRGLWMR